MKKVLLFVLALGLFSSFVSAQSLENRQLAKINAKQALKFPQTCNIEQSVINAAKRMYENNQNNFEAVYNYAVTLSAGDCDDLGPYIPAEQVRLAKRLFTKALELKPSSPSCFAGLGFLTLYETGLSEALFYGDNANDGTLFPRAVKEHQTAAQKALDYYKKAKQNGYPVANDLQINEVISRLTAALRQIKGKKTGANVRRAMGK